MTTRERPPAWLWLYCALLAAGAFLASALASCQCMLCYEEGAHHVVPWTPRDLQAFYQTRDCLSAHFAPAGTRYADTLIFEQHVPLVRVEGDGILLRNPDGSLIVPRQLAAGQAKDGDSVLVKAAVLDDPGMRYAIIAHEAIHIGIQRDSRPELFDLTKPPNTQDYWHPGRVFGSAACGIIARE